MQGLADQVLVVLRYGGILHDIGMLVLPDMIELKNGPEPEWQLICKRTVVGAQLCQGLGRMSLIAAIIRRPHKR